MKKMKIIINKIMKMKEKNKRKISKWKIIMKDNNENRRRNNEENEISNNNENEIMKNK